MRMQPKLFAATIGLSSLFFIQSSFAYYCSTQAGRGYINIGDSMDKVSQNVWYADKYE